MIFSELYSAYYNAVAHVIGEALDHPLSKSEIRKIVEEDAFGESAMNVETALAEERWQVIKDDGTTVLNQKPEMPLTLLQKRWLKAVMRDPRVRLFTDDLSDWPDVEPLFTSEDYFVFDKYGDGDDFESEEYKKIFRSVLDAVRNRYPIRIRVDNRWGRTMKKTVLPLYFEYSEKDDKFRVIAAGKRFNSAINLGRIRSCERATEEYEEQDTPAPVKKQVVMELYDRRNALERVLLHFAHFEKEAEKIGEDRYKVSITYDADDEVEMVIRILGFGPMVKVIEPESFVNLIRTRLREQKSCGF